MSNLLQGIETFFAQASAFSEGLPLIILVPLIMILAAIGTAVIVTLLMGLIRLIFGKKAVDFIKDMPQRLNRDMNK